MCLLIWYPNKIQLNWCYYFVHKRPVLIDLILFSHLLNLDNTTIADFIENIILLKNRISACFLCNLCFDFDTPSPLRTDFKLRITVHLITGVAKVAIRVNCPFSVLKDD